MPPPFKTNPFYLPCLLGISRKDDKAEVSCVKQDTTSLHYVFLFTKAPAFLHPQGRAPLCLYDIFFFTTAFYRVCKPMPPHTYTTSYTHIYLYDQNGKKTNTTFFLKGCSVNSSFTTWFSKKENTLRIKEECMYKMAYRIIRLNGMHLHKNENGPT